MVRQPLHRKGKAAEGSNKCLLNRFWAAQEDWTDCHKTLWSAIEIKGMADAVLIFHGPLAKRFIFIFPTGRDTQPEG